MPTNKLILNKGIKYIAASLPFLFIGPVVVTNAFMNKDNNWHFLVLAIGIALSGGAMFLLFKGIKTLVQSFFD